jgi:Lon protease-like protein
VFVCSLALPLLPCPLHIFEPRYRLMIRRCVDSGQKRFGMVLPTPSGDGYMDCGTLLRIRSLEQLADGRSKIETIGDRRFRIVERSMRDGYHYCRVEWIDDVAEQLSSAELASQLHNALSNLLARLAAHPLLMQQLEHGCGKLPAADAPEHISFYAISLLSNVQQFEQDLLYELTYLPSLRQRLERLLAIIPTGPAR